jgi:hypothetical protein
LLHNETVQQTGTHNKCEAAGGIIAGTPVKLLAGPAADLNSVRPSCPHFATTLHR